MCVTESLIPSNIAISVLEFTAQVVPCSFMVLKWE